MAQPRSTGMRSLPGIVIGLLLAGCQWADADLGRNVAAPAHSPSREVIEHYRDSNVRVFGRYAVVKLPITSGVAIRNPAYVARGPDGLIYAANRTGEIYSLRDTDGDGLEDHAQLYHNLNADSAGFPTGMIFNGRDLYVGVSRGVRIYTDRDGDGAADSSRIFFDGAPFSGHPYEFTSALAFGADGHLYAALSTDSWHPGSAPDPSGWRGSILRLSPQGHVERFATGLRSVHGMEFNVHGDLFFADNRGGDNAGEELNLAQRGGFYGHNPTKYGHPPVTGPLLSLHTEIAPVAITFNAADNDFGGTAGDLFIAFYGPDRRWERGAIGRVRLDRQPDGSYHAAEFPVATGIGKVTDLDFGLGGDLYISQIGRTGDAYQSVDEPEGAFYRLLPASWIDPSPLVAQAGPGASVSKEVLARGVRAFEARCALCHTVDGSTRLVGPDLTDVGWTYSRDELLEEIVHPSRRMDPTMAARRITTRDGVVTLGRVVGSDEQRVRLMTADSRIVEIARSEVVTDEAIKQSLMPEALLNSVSKQDVDALLLYLLNLYRTK